MESTPMSEHEFGKENPPHDGDHGTGAEKDPRLEGQEENTTPGAGEQGANGRPHPLGGGARKGKRKSRDGYPHGERYDENTKFVANYLYSLPPKEPGGKTIPYGMVKRTDQKQFPQFHYKQVTTLTDANDPRNWSPGEPKPKIPYNLPRLALAAPDATFYHAEGEKDADTLIDLGLLATCHTGGASYIGADSKIKGWASELAEYYRGHPVVLFEDNDPDGRRHVQIVAKQLQGVAASIKVVRFCDMPEKSDVSDWCEQRAKELFGEEFKHLNREQFAVIRDELLEMAVDWKSPGCEEGSKPSKPLIQLSTHLDIDLRACAEALIDSPRVEIFQRGGSLVMRGIVKGKTHTGAEINDDAIIMHCAESLRDALAVAADFEKLKGNKYVECYPPHELAGALIKCAPLIGRFPVLRGLTSIPTIRADGSILDKPGYDPATGLYYDPKGIDFGDMPHDATMEDARAALEELKALIREFPFVDEASRSVALARFLTGVARHAMKVAVMFAYNAPSPRTGKSKLNDTGSMITCGHEAPVISATSSPEEREKQLVAALRGGTQTITLDNLPNGVALESELICQMLTQERIEVRAFHSNDKLIVLPNTALVVANGNNMGVSADMTERTILCRLDAKMELPGLRKFDFDPVEVVRADRPKYVRFCLTILRAFAIAGYPGAEDLSALGGFEEWSRIVRAALVWLGCVDPCETMNTIRAEDPKRGNLIAVMEHFESAFGRGPKTVAEVIKHAEREAKGIYEERYGETRLTKEGDGAFLNALMEFTNSEKGGRISAISLGRRFKANEGVVINGRRFFAQSHGKHKGAKLYYLLSTDEEEPAAQAENDDDVGM
jgi:putative DNA primase/helicase